MTTDTFNGWACTGKGGPLQWTELALKKFESTDIEMDITHCGICGSDVHAMDSGWGPTQYPCVVGHEITGVVTRVGDLVTKVRVGDRIGVGGQCSSCLECERCKLGSENTCEKGVVGTYNGNWPSGEKTYGGYADKWRGDQYFTFKIPDDMTNDMAATFFCGGITTYAPLRRHNVKKGDRVGVIGIGGLGHFGVLWAKAMGAEVVALSHSARKRDDAFALGCSDFVISTDAEEMAKNHNTLTHILCTSYAPNFPWGGFLPLMKANGTFIFVAAPEEPISGIPPFALLLKQVQIVGSVIGSPAEIEEMLKFAAEKNVQPWISKYRMADVATAIEDFRAGKPRYRFVLEN